MMMGGNDSLRVDVCTVAGVWANIFFNARSYQMPGLDYLK